MPPNTKPGWWPGLDVPSDGHGAHSPPPQPADLAFGLATADMFAGAYLVQGILACLVRRGKTSKGGLVEVSLMEAVLDHQFEVLTTHLNDGGKLPERSTFNNAHAYLAAPYGIYATADGYIAIAMENARLYHSLEREAAQIERLNDFSESIVESLSVGVLTTGLARAARDAQVVVTLVAALELLEQYVGVLAGHEDDRGVSVHTSSLGEGASRGRRPPPRPRGAPGRPGAPDPEPAL